MPSLRSNSLRLVLLPVLLAVSLVLPTLHLHHTDRKSHGPEPHQHAVIHADFFSISAHDQRHMQHEDVELGGAPAGFSQSNLVALPARGLESLVKVLETVLAFLTFDLVGVRAQAVKYGRFLKREHPPPRHPVFLTPNSPRSPPTFAFA